jgi:hypothetical protein
MRMYWLRSFFMGRELKYLWGSVWQSHTPLYKEHDKKKKDRMQTAFCARLHAGIRFSIKYNGTSITVGPSSQKCEIIL